MGLTRRRFIALTAAGGAATAFAPLRAAPARVEALHLAILGVGRKGRQHLSELVSKRGVVVTAICDPDTRSLDAARAVLQKTGLAAKEFRDDRDVYDRSDVDAVLIASPDHQHARQTLLACKARKHAYVEKPGTYDFHESLVVPPAVAASGVIVQAGSQKRSCEGIAAAWDFLRSGEIGPIRRIYATIFNRRAPIGKVDGPQPIPPQVDYDVWCGPSPLKPLMRRRLQYDWHWDWDTGTGEIGNFAPHELDLARWLLGNPGLPSRVLSVGGRFGPPDDGQTPNTQVAIFDFNAVPVYYIVQGLPAKTGADEVGSFRGIRVGLIVDCEGGTFTGGGGGGRVVDTQGKLIKRFSGTGGATHMDNFLASVRSGRASDLRAPIGEACLSAALAHMANASHRSGAPASPPRIREALGSDSSANELLDFQIRHLAANGIDAATTPFTLGSSISWDGRSFGSPGADRFLKREYREPFTLEGLTV